MIKRNQWSQLCGETFRRCRSHFMEYFPPLILAAALAYGLNALLQTLNQILSARFLDISDFNSSPSFFDAWGRFLWRGSFGFMKLFTTLMVFSFSLATVYFKMFSEQKRPTDREPRVFEALGVVATKRWGSLTTLCLFAAVAMMAFLYVLGPLLLRIFFALTSRISLQLDSVYDAAVLFEFIILSPIAAKAVLAIPRLIDDKSTTLRQSLTYSFSATTRWEPFFFVVFVILYSTVFWCNSVGLPAIRKVLFFGPLNASASNAFVAGFVIISDALILLFLTVLFSAMYDLLYQKPDSV